MRSSCQAFREGEVASEKIDSPERRCRQRHGKARPPIPRSFLWDVIFRGGSCQKSGSFHQLGKRAQGEGSPSGSRADAGLALCLRSLAAAKCEGREVPFESPPRTFR